METDKIFQVLDRVAKTVAEMVYVQSEHANCYTDSGDSVQDIPEIVKNYMDGVVSVELFGRYSADTLGGCLKNLKDAGYSVPGENASLRELICFINETNNFEIQHVLVFNPADNSLTLLYNGKTTVASQVQELAAEIKLISLENQWDDIEIMEFDELPE